MTGIARADATVAHDNGVDPRSDAARKRSR